MQGKVSFSTLEKEKITADQYKSLCCRKALLSGVLYTKAFVKDGKIQLLLSGDNTVSFASTVISQIYGNTPEIKIPPVGGRAKLLSFTSPAAEKYLSSDFNDKLPYERRCKSCDSSFLRGAFLASGRCAEPEKQFLMEFSFVEAPERYLPFVNFLSRFEIEAKFMTRKRENIIYIKKSSCIENFFGKCKLNDAYFRFADAKINKQLRNETNRRVNCETNNITRAVNASQNQIAIITELEARGLLSSLPEELERTARLRIRYRDLTLTALAQASVPPISKSGLSHRLNKIMEIGERLLGNKK